MRPPSQEYLRTRKRLATAKAQGLLVGAVLGGSLWVLQTLTGIRLDTWTAGILTFVFGIGSYWGLKQGGLIKVSKRTARVIRGFETSHPAGRTPYRREDVWAVG
jgi:hypothetical protein